MAVLGADPEELRDLAKAMRSSQARISDATSRLGDRVRANAWTGKDALDFEARWRTHEASLSSAAALLSALAVTLDEQAFEQEEASGAGGRPFAAGEPGPPQGSPGPTALPVRTETLWADSRLALALGIEVGTKVTIELLPDGSAVVWMQDSGGLDADTGVGASVGSDDAGLAVSAEAGVSAAGAIRKGWIIDADDIDSLAPDVLAERGADLLGRGLDLLFGGSSLGPMWALTGTGPGSAVADDIEGLTGLGLGTPDYIQTSLNLGADTDAALSAGPTLAGTGALVATSAGIRTGPGGRSLIISGRGGFESQAGSKHRDALVESHVEVPLSRSGPTELTVTTRTVLGEDYTLSRATYRIPESEMRGVAEAVDGRSIPRAVQKVLGVIGSVGEPLYSVESQGLGDRQGIAGLGADAKLGFKAEVGIGIGRESVHYGTVADRVDDGRSSGSW